MRFRTSISMLRRRTLSCATTALTSARKITWASFRSGHESVRAEIVRIGEQDYETLQAGPETGEPVILLHGFPDLATTWSAQIQALADAGFQCFAFNQRGYGRSYRPEGIPEYHLDVLARDVLKFAD